MTLMVKQVHCTTREHCSQRVLSPEMLRNNLSVGKTMTSDPRMVLAGRFRDIVGRYYEVSGEKHMRRQSPELEIRFRTTSVSTGVDVESFYALRSILRSRTKGFFDEYKVGYHSQRGVLGSVRHVERRVRGHPQYTIEVKNTIKKIKNHSLGFKVALSLESTKSPNNPHFSDIANREPLFVRHISRESFVLDGSDDLLPAYEGVTLRFDLSIVNKTGKGDPSIPNRAEASKLSYEVELEFERMPEVHPGPLFVEYLSSVISTTHMLMASISTVIDGRSYHWLNKSRGQQDDVSKFVATNLYSKTQRKTIPGAMSALAHKTVDLRLDDLFTLEGNYLVTTKIDGKRGLLYTLESKTYLINYRRAIFLGHSNLTNSIIDCEVYINKRVASERNEGTLTLFCFDLLYCASSSSGGLTGRSMRSYLGSPFSDRYKQLQLVIQGGTGTGVTITGVDTIICKDYYPADPEGTEAALETPYRSDGLIFVAEKLKYTDSRSSYKWKERMTIDLYMSKHRGLMMVDPKGKWIQVAKYFQGIEVKFDESDLRKHSGRVLELLVTYDGTKIVLSFDRERPDRPKPNSLLVLKSVFNTVIRPVKKQTLLGEDAEMGVRYLNIYKRCLLSRILEKVTGRVPGDIRLLDIGTGPGSDIFKWGKIKEIVAVEPDGKSIGELKKRIKAVGGRVTPFHGTLNDYPSNSVPFSTITSFFSMTQILAPEEASYKAFFDKLNDLLVVGGVFMGIYMDPLFINAILDGTTKLTNVSVERVSKTRVKTRVGTEREFDEYVISPKLLNRSIGEHFDVLLHQNVREFNVELDGESKELVRGHRIIILRKRSSSAPDELGAFKSLIERSGEMMTTEEIEQAFNQRNPGAFRSSLSLNGPSITPRRCKEDGAYPHVYKCRFSLSIPHRGQLMFAVRYLTSLLKVDPTIKEVLMTGQFDVYDAVLLGVLFDGINITAFQNSTDVVSLVEGWADRFKIDPKAHLNSIVSRITTVDEEFSDKDSAAFEQANKLVYISFDGNDKDSLSKQKTLIELVRPSYCACEFHVPHGEKKFEYFSGELCTLPWMDDNSPQTMLIVDKDFKVKQYSHSSYLSVIAYHNTIVRQWAVYKENRSFKKYIDGYDACYDCTFEAKTWVSYHKLKPSYITTRCIEMVSEIVKERGGTWNPVGKIHGKFPDPSPEDKETSYKERLRLRFNMCDQGSTITDHRAKRMQKLMNENHHCAQMFLDPRLKVRDDIAFTRELVNNSPSLPYSNRERVTKTLLHWGQRKLLMSEIEFLTRYTADTPAGARTRVVYVGAAPGHHIPVLLEMFPAVDFTLYDSENFNRDLVSRGDRRVTIVKRYFTDSDARSFHPNNKREKRSEVLFISDIRALKYGSKHSISHNSAAINENMETQNRWRLLMDPKASLLKFRLNWDDNKTVYPNGILTFPVWGKRDTTECRLMVERGEEDREYDNRHHEGQMAYFNTVTRPALYDQPIRGGGLDRCYDCKAETYIIAKYLSSIRALPGEPAARNKIIREFSEKISERIGTKYRSNLRVKIRV